MVGKIHNYIKGEKQVNRYLKKIEEKECHALGMELLEKPLED